MENNQVKDTISKQINSSFDGRKMLASLAGNWYWVLLSLIVALAVAFTYLRYTTPVYAVNSTLLIDEKNDITRNVLSKLDAGSSKGDNTLYNEIFQLRSK